ncbi:hypothetical protein SAMN05428984_4494 [Sphingomonas sp. OK281]|nr:hypothetical protein SAMN05428984_4494 [Sphingomonas sp. OK281]
MRRQARLASRAGVAKVSSLATQSLPASPLPLPRFEEGQSGTCFGERASREAAAPALVCPSISTDLPMGKPELTRTSQLDAPRSGWGAGTAPQTNKVPTAGTVGTLNFYEVSPPQQTLLNETIPIDCTVNTRLPESGWPVCFPTGPLARIRFLRESWLGTGHYAEGASASMIRQSATVLRLQESISASSSPASAVRSAILRLIASRCWLATTSTAMQD